MDYERGLARLRPYMNGKEEEYFLIYEHRLRENLNNEQLYGSTEQLRAERAQVVAQLNNLASRVASISFNSLCLDTQPGAVHGNHAASTIKSHSSASQHSKTYICFSGPDKLYLNELHLHLDQYAHKVEIDYWDTTKIMPGTNRLRMIEDAINATRVAILLVSADLLASEFINKHEIPPLLEAASIGKAVLLNVIVRPCAFPYSRLEPYSPVNTVPLSKLTPDQREEVWDSVAMQVQNILQTNT